MIVKNWSNSLFHLAAFGTERQPSLIKLGARHEKLACSPVPVWRSTN